MENVASHQAGRHAPRMMRFLPALILAFGAAAASLWLLFIGLARLSGSELPWWKPGIGDLAADRLFDVTRATATAAGVLAGVFAVLYSYRKQRVEEADGQRKDAELLAKRYQEAATQLGHDRAPVRLAGVYAMSKLADDWPVQRQECVDVLCAYLRLPHAKGAASDDAVVRRAIVDQILLKTSMKMDGRESWSELRLDLSGVALGGMQARDCRFSDLILDRATVLGDWTFSIARYREFYPHRT